VAKCNLWCQDPIKRFHLERNYAIRLEHTIKKLTILGSTGSIGENALRVVRAHQEKFDLIGISAHSNYQRLIEQAREFHPRAVCIANEQYAESVKEALADTEIEIYNGRTGLLELAARDDANLLLNGLVGTPGMEPTITAIEHGVYVALSNKESLVMAGDLINRSLAKHKVKLFPVDSEHSAIWQCLVGEDSSQIRRLILTGSGGPFRTTPMEQFNQLTVEEALNHPNWNMGNKITIDSATMMNKGLEVIEAHWLFDIAPDAIDIVVHPQSIIHSMVEFVDGSVKAQLGVPDMKVPIQYALMYPEHAPADWERLDLASLGQLTFEEPDLEKFRSIALAYKSLDSGGSSPAVLNVANETAVYAFLDRKISFDQIPVLVEEAIENHEHVAHPSLENLLELEEWTKSFISAKLNLA